MLKLDHEKNEGNPHNLKDERVIPVDEPLRQRQKERAAMCLTGSQEKPN